MASPQASAIQTDLLDLLDMRAQILLAKNAQQIGIDLRDMVTTWSNDADLLAALLSPTPDQPGAMRESDRHRWDAKRSDIPRHLKGTFDALASRSLLLGHRAMWSVGAIDDLLPSSHRRSEALKRSCAEMQAAAEHLTAIAWQHGESVRNEAVEAARVFARRSMSSPIALEPDSLAAGASLIKQLADVCTKGVAIMHMLAGQSPRPEPDAGTRVLL